MKWLPFGRFGGCALHPIGTLGLYAKSRRLFGARRSCGLLADSYCVCVHARVCVYKSINIHYISADASLASFECGEVNKRTFGNEYGLIDGSGLERDGTGTWYGLGE